MDEFLVGYYGNASRYVKEYIQLIHSNVQSDTLNIYGNPIDYHDGYLSLKNMDDYSSIMDKAEIAVEGDRILEKRIERIRMSHEYTFLQQARFYGIEKHGIFHKDKSGEWRVNDRLEERIDKLVTNSINRKVIEISKGEVDQRGYQLDWERIINLE